MSMDPRPTYRCTLTNPQGWMLTIHCPNRTQEQPYDWAERVVNDNPEHKPHGPWAAYKTDRAS